MDTSSKPLQLPQLPKPDLSPPAVIIPEPTPPAEPDAPPVQQRSPRVKRKTARRAAGLRWPNVVLGMFGTCGVLALGAYVWLTRLPPPINCQSVSPFAPDADRLYCAREAVRTGGTEELLESLNLVNQWSPNQPLYAEAHELLDRWASEVFRLAADQYKQNQLQQAIDLAKQVPSSSAVYPDAQAAIATWQAEWQTGETLYTSAQEALKQQDWDTASDYIFELSKLESQHWRIEVVNDLTRRLGDEKTAHNFLQQAQALAKKETPDQLVEAIALVQQIAPERYVWATAKDELARWSQQLVAIALAQWQAGNHQSALELAQHVATEGVDDPVAQDLVRVSQAYQLVQQAETAWEPSLMQWLNLQDAIAAVQTIAPDSPFYAQVQADRANWQAQLQDVQQLQFANATASLGQRWTYQLAIGQAQQIEADRPRRLQAQTLAAHWGQEIQRIEDQPVLSFARQLATTGAVADLQQAIRVAARVPTGRALWPDAQAAITQWQDQIETIEDKPILDKALALAEDQELRAAIRTARDIGRDRALYDQAQAAIEIWRGQIRAIEIAEDRPILNDAYGLAERERYTLAIERASQIGEGRALYDEARAAMRDWRIRRQALLDQWAAEAEAESYSEDYSDPNAGYDDGYSEESY